MLTQMPQLIAYDAAMASSIYQQQSLLEQQQMMVSVSVISIRTLIGQGSSRRFCIIRKLGKTLLCTSVQKLRV